MVIRSSLFVYELKIGDFTTFLDSGKIDCDLLGYYPLVFYSKRTQVIPEASNSKTLPPLVLINTSKSSEYLHFWGQTPNTDFKFTNFVLEATELSLGTPEECVSFFFYFDLISKSNNFYLDKFVRFNIGKLSLKYVDSSDSQKTLFTLILDVAFQSSGKTLAKNGVDLVHKGTLKLLLNTAGSTLTQQVVKQDYKIVSSKTSNPYEIENLFDGFYETEYLRDFNLKGLLSAQPLYFTVGLVCLGNFRSIWTGSKKQ